MPDDLTEAYEAWWYKNGLANITPQGLANPEGFDVGEWIKRALGDVSPEHTILEFGCGTGRLARYFNPQIYIGVDINPLAIREAKGFDPAYAFHLVDTVQPLPRAHHVFAHTVFVHIPDQLVEDQLDRCLAAVDGGRFVISEIMFNGINSPTDGTYRMANNRTTFTYETMMISRGWMLEGSQSAPYAYYRGKTDHFITSLAFEKGLDHGTG